MNKVYLRSAYDAFILSRRLAGLTDKTIYSYRCFVLPFVLFYPAEMELEVLTHDRLNEYLLLLIERRISKATLSTYVRHIKIFLKWISENYESVSFNYRKIRVPKSPKKNVRIYSDSEIRLIFDSIETGIDWVTARNRAIVALMLDSGLRQSEVCRLLKKTVYFNDSRMCVYGKGNKERIVPLGNFSKSLLMEYLNLCPYSSEFVFVTKTGDSLSCNTVKLLVSKLARKLPFELSSHKLRHNFATNYCLDQYEEKGHIDIYRLMYLMGHEDVETTRCYLHFAYEIISAKGCISHVDMIFK